KGIVLTSGKQDVFVAGGDLEQIESMGSGPIDAEEFLKSSGAVLDQLRRMETCGKPIVAALNGVTLGGGYEIALSCHRRILVNQRHAKVGLPEAGLGLMPGLGGTQRLPRLIGVQGALGLIMQGKQLAPDQALKQGLVDELVEPQDLIPAAKKWIAEGGSATQPWDQKGYQVPGGGADSVNFAQTLMGSNAMTHAATFGNMPSQQAILQSVYEGLGLPMDRAGKVELRQFIRVLQDPTARAMLRTLFFSLQECQKGVRRPKDVPRFDVKKVGIIGAGLMGQGIAHVSAKVGIEVVLLDRDLASAERGKATVAKGLERRLKKGRTTPERVEGILGRILPSENYADLKGCDVVVEAVFEDRDIKAKVTKATDEQLGDEELHRPSLLLAGGADADGGDRGRQGHLAGDPRQGLGLHPQDQEGGHRRQRQPGLLHQPRVRHLHLRRQSPPGRRREAGVDRERSEGSGYADAAAWDFRYGRHRHDVQGCQAGPEGRGGSG
ncbi:MAG: enoyl-CoA hydratase/isomerase family protein, partial [Deltaproteobacteria bacterium]|nr:enoyl-CoA hydratase/isomerase family protein [Deltaproteobacteria bacterium]